MAQQVSIYKPIYLNTDADVLSLKNEESPFIKDYSVNQKISSDFQQKDYTNGRNGGIGTGTPLLGNVELCTPLLPEGFNKRIGAGQFIETNELYVLFYNSNKNHGIYLIDGDTMKCSSVIIDPNLNFSLDPAFSVPEHRMALRVVYDEGDGESRRVVEKHLLFTDGNNWQRWINVNAAIKTEGFNEIKFPYFKTRYPHYDRAEYIDLATRPPMFCPKVSALPFTNADKGKINKLLNASIQFAYAYVYTDGRKTTFSPYSLPFSVTASSCNPNSSNLSRCLELTLGAGSAMVESVQLAQRKCNGDWVLYDTIKRFTDCGDNDFEKIGYNYWERTNQWAGLSYNEAANTFKYKWCGDKEGDILSQDEIKTRFQSDLPIKSVAMTNAGDAILLANNLYGYDNLGCSVTDKIKLSLQADAETAGCKVETVKLTLYSYIGSGDNPDFNIGGEFNPNFRCQFAHKKGEDSTDIYFGSYVTRWIYKDLKWQPTLLIDYNVCNRFGLRFKEKDGFIMYLAGTPYFAIGQQYAVKKDGTMDFVGVIDTDNKEQMNFVRSHVDSGGIFVMKYEFAVPKGKYIARLSGHQSMPEDDYAKTSTWVMGIADSRLRTYDGRVLDFFFAKKTYAKEIELDATAGDLDLWGTGSDTFFVFAPYDHEYILESGLKQKRWRFNEGYVYEDFDENIGVELVRYTNNQGYSRYLKDGYYTDHNGFFFAYSARGEARKAEVDFWGNFKCQNSGTILYSTKNGRQKGGFLNWGSESINIVYDISVKENNSGQFGDCNRVVVRGKLTDCDGLNPIAGVAVTLSRGMTAFTGSDGTFELYAHNSFEGIRKDRIYVNAGGECLFYTCNCEAPVVYDYDDSLAPCTVCNLREYPISIDAKYKLVVGRNKALKGGSRVGVGIVGFDLAGRATFVNLIDYVDIPTFMETGDFNPRKIRWDIIAPLGLPKEVAYVSFFRTGNLNYSSYLQWVGDKIEFLNTKGEVVDNKSGLIRAKIGIQSLLDFNDDNNFATTVRYQVQKGDIVRFYDDGEGNLFDPAVNDGFMDYPILGTNYNESVQSQISVQANGNNITFNPVQASDGKTIVIGYDKRLESLRDKCGFWMEILRPRDTTEKEIYCEICGVYPVRNGELIDNVTGGVLETWDTYYQNRFIQIEECSGKAFNHPFESNSITDYWGEDCSSCGRISYRDPRATQRWYPDDVIKSDEFINEGRVNGLGTYREKNRKQFKGQEWGGIVAMKAERSIIMFICNNDWFATSYDMNYVRALSDGRIAASNLENNINDPYQKSGDNYGCEYANTSAIIFYNGFAFWVDIKNRAVLQSNFQSVTKISDIDNSTYFDAKFNHIIKHNAFLLESDYLNKLFDITLGMNPETDECYLTFRKRNISGAVDSGYENENREISISESETIVFSVENKKWMRFTGMIPDGYSMLKHSSDGMIMVAFKGAVGYAHNAGGDAFNTFFGIKHQAIFEVVCYEKKEKNEVYQSVAIECNNGDWYVDKIITNEPNSFSYIPVKYFKKEENILYAEMLRDMNSYPDADDVKLDRSMLFDGKRLFGQFIRMRFVSGMRTIGKFFQLNEILLRTTNSERSGK